MTILQATPNDGTHAPTAERSRTRLRPPRVLLAEDDRPLRELLASTLRAEGYVVDECTDGLDAMAALCSRELEDDPGYYALAISDIRMPSFTGLDVLADIHSNGNPPLILITAFGDEALHRKARRMGARAVLDKPFELEDLLAAVHAVVPPAERA